MVKANAYDHVWQSETTENFSKNKPNERKNIHIKMFTPANIIREIIQTKSF